MKRYRAEVWKTSVSPNKLEYCSDWLDDKEDARVLKRDALNEARDFFPEERFQGIVKIAWEEK